MKSLIQSWGRCVVALVVCVVVVFFQTLIDGTIKSNTTVSTGMCTAVSVEKAEALSRPLYNDLKPGDLILKLTCDGAVYATAKADPILAWQAGVQTFRCKRQANGIAVCEVPTVAAK